MLGLLSPYPPKSRRGERRRGILRKLCAPLVGKWVLLAWLLGGVFLPLLHQVDHDHAHTHGSYRLLQWGDQQGEQQVVRFLLRPHSHTPKQSHHVRPHRHEHIVGAGLWSRASRWLAHVWSHWHGHHHEPHHAHKQKASGEADAASTLFDPAHGTDSLAHFDLLDKTTAVWLPSIQHQPQLQPDTLVVAQQPRTAPRLTTCAPRAPPA